MAYFAQQWIDCGQRRAEYILASGVRSFFAFNSPADDNVPPSTYLPLHALLSTITYHPATPAFGGADGWPHDAAKLAVTTLVLPGLAHEDFLLGPDTCAKCGCDLNTKPITLHVCPALLGAVSRVP